ncbi:GrdX family protein [Oceanivirga salmonicida]|uniref:GrdX family protein n=1 Tax=Oceanivirga salmonicida TaxID=1769291 RepID=UPI00082E34F0|nr:GrdX family protein [Oceanivirga salmonicida]
MWNIEKVILITNNDKVYEKYKDTLQCIFVRTYEEVLIKARNFVYDRHILLTHPQASSLKPNQTPYRSVMVYPKSDKEDNMKDILLIEKCIEIFKQWQEISHTPKNYEQRIAEDFKTIDLSVIDNIIPRVM